MKLKKLIGQVHLWLGLTSGLVVFILGITGCLFVFEEELRPLIHDYYTVEEVQEKPLPLSELLSIANDTLESIIPKPVNSIIIDNEEERSIEFRSFIRNTATTSIWYWDQRTIINAYVNPYNGRVVKIENSDFEFFQIVMMLHWSLLMTNDIGQPIVGIATLIFVIMLITGLVLWWPKRRKKAIKQRLWFQWKNTTRWKRKNFDLHNIFGFYAMVFALIIALTGLVWAFDWFDNSVQWIANGGETIESVQENRTSNASQFTFNKPLDKIYAQVKANHPKAASYFIALPQDTIAAQRIFVNYEGKVNDISLHFDQYTGELLSVDSWEDKNNGEKIKSLNYDIHVGSILGFPGKILAFCVSLIAASLPVTGFLIWWGRRKKKSILKNTKQRSNQTRIPNGRNKKNMHSSTFTPEDKNYEEIKNQ